MTQLWSCSKANCPREKQGENDYDWIGRTCQCGHHLKECPACGRLYAFWNNPHYQGGVGHLSGPSDYIEEPYWSCTKEPVRRVEPGPF